MRSKEIFHKIKPASKIYDTIHLLPSKSRVARPKLHGLSVPDSLIFQAFVMVYRPDKTGSFWVRRLQFFV
jgi:hypothetical protein